MAEHRFGITKRVKVFTREDQGLTDKVGHSCDATDYEVVEVFEGKSAEAQALYALDTRYRSTVSVIGDKLVLTEYWESAEMDGYIIPEDKFWTYNQGSKLEPLYQALYDFVPSLWECHDIIMARAGEKFEFPTGDIIGIKMTEEEGRNHHVSYMRPEGRPCFYIIKGEGVTIKAEYNKSADNWLDHTLEYYN